MSGSELPLMFRAGLVEIARLANEFDDAARRATDLRRDDERIWLEAKSIRLRAAYHRIAFGSPIAPKGRPDTEQLKDSARAQSRERELQQELSALSEHFQALFRAAAKPITDELEAIIRAKPMPPYTLPDGTEVVWVGPYLGRRP